MASLFRVRTQLVGGAGGDQVSTMFFSDNGTLTAQHAADAVRQFWFDGRAYFSNAYVASVEPAVYSIDTATGQPTAIHVTSTAGVGGGNASDQLPWATQGVVRWNTGAFVGGRQVLGHTFIPGPCEDSSTAGVPSTNYVTTWGTAAATMISDILSELDVYSRKNNMALGVQSATVWTKWGILRSRRS